MEHQRALPAGTRIEEYRLETVLGAGGFGITYRAHDTHLAKPVAIKEYLPGEFAMRAADSTVVPNSDTDADDYAWGLARFLDEARTLARFDHPHLNKVHRFFEANGTAYLVLDYVEGEPLSAVLRQQKTLPAEELERLLSDVLSGLEAVHAAGYVHRDVKPGNLMVRPDGHTVLLDFGAARQAIGQRSKSVTAILTPGYAPIEQYDSKAEDVGPWSDLYALGMVAYRCVSGLSDTELPDAVTRARKGDAGFPPAVEVGKGRYPPKLLAAIDHAIQVKETARPQSVAAWRTQMAGFAAGAGTAPARSPAETLSPLRREPASQSRSAPARSSGSGQKRVKVTAALVAAVVLVGGGYFLGREGTLPRTPPSGVLTAAPEAERATGPTHAQTPESSQQPAPTLPVTASDDGRPRPEGRAEPALSPPVTAAVVPEVPGEQDMVQQPVPSSAPRVTPPVAVPPPPPRPDPGAVETALGLGRTERRLVQQGLTAAGQAPGPVDGLFGAGPETRTRRALRAWQAATGFEETGYLTQEQADTLMAQGRQANAARARQTEQNAALRQAAKAGDTASVRALLAGGAQPNVQAENDATALMEAAWKGHTASVEALLAGGAQPDMQEDEMGGTALMMAAMNGHTASVEALLAGGARPNVQDKRGRTALTWAAFQGHTASVEALLAGGAQPDVRDEKGWTALMSAALKGHTASVAALLAGGARPDVQNKGGATALDLARSAGHFKIVWLLEAAGGRSGR